MAPPECSKCNANMYEKKDWYGWFLCWKCPACGNDRPKELEPVDLDNWD